MKQLGLKPDDVTFTCQQCPDEVVTGISTSRQKAYEGHIILNIFIS